MHNCYKYIGKFIDNYVFVFDVNTSCKGVIDNKENEIIPVIYDGFIGSLYDQFIIGYKYEKELVTTPVDWDIDNYSLDYIYKGTFFYLIDKEGHNFYLDFNPESKVTYSGISYDGAINFNCEYEYKEYLDIHYRKKYDYYKFYPGDNFVIVKKNSDTIYIQHFDGTKEDISDKQFKDIIKKVKVKKL